MTEEESSPIVVEDEESSPMMAEEEGESLSSSLSWHRRWSLAIKVGLALAIVTIGACVLMGYDGSLSLRMRSSGNKNLDHNSNGGEAKLDWAVVPWIAENKTAATNNNNNNNKDDEDDWKLLFVGNSYTSHNQLGFLVENILESQLSSHSSTSTSTVNHKSAKVLVRTHDPGATTFQEHYATTEKSYHQSFTNPSYNPQELRKWLVTRPAQWNWVILQEQSQVPGFWDIPVDDRSSFNKSVEASQHLNDLIAHIKGAQTMFYLTWGRRNGDDYNTYLYPDYMTMQARITKGYFEYVKATSTPERPTYVAPVGLVFQSIYQDELQKHGPNYNPSNSTESFFYQLYDVDGSHPSLAGSYLAALTIYASLTGGDPRTVTWIPQDLEAAMAQQVQVAVAKTIFETATTGNIQYPWHWQQSQAEEEEEASTTNATTAP